MTGSGKAAHQLDVDRGADPQRSKRRSPSEGEQDAERQRADRGAARDDHVQIEPTPKRRIHAALHLQ